MTTFIYNQQVKPYVYCCTHRETGKMYIGFRCANILPALEDFPKYKTSADYVKNYFDEFVWEILQEFDDKREAFDFEQEIIDGLRDTGMLLNRFCYKTGWTNAGRPLSEDTKKKLSLANKGKRKGVPKPEGFGEKISQARLGKSNHWLKGKPGNARGKKWSQEAKEKRSKAYSGEGNPNYGKHKQHI